MLTKKLKYFWNLKKNQQFLLITFKICSYVLIFSVLFLNWKYFKEENEFFFSSFFLKSKFENNPTMNFNFYFNYYLSIINKILWTKNFDSTDHNDCINFLSEYSQNKLSKEKKIHSDFSSWYITSQTLLKTIIKLTNLAPFSKYIEDLK